MESNSHSIDFGENVRNIRKKMGMSQVEFYKFLFPESKSSEEAIKKKINKIERGKQKSVDLEMFLRICHKCDISADFLIGKEKNFSNYDIKSVSEYTGLSEKAIKQLHKWSIDKNIKINKDLCDEVVWVSDSISDETQYDKMRKEDALIFLGMFNLLFEEVTDTVTINGHRRKERFSNLSIIHSLYMLCVDQPMVILGHLTKEYMEDNFGYGTKHSDYASMEASNLLYQDENGVFYPLNMNIVIQQQARKRLDKAIDLLRMQIEDKRENAKNSSENDPLNIFE